MITSRQLDLITARRLFFEDVTEQCVVKGMMGESEFQMKVEQGVYDDSPEIRLILKAIEVTRKEYEDLEQELKVRTA